MFPSLTPPRFPFPTPPHTAFGTGAWGLALHPDNGSIAWTFDDEGNGHRINFAGGRAIVALVPGTGNLPRDRGIVITNWS